jgi:hypothetical protein
MHSVIEESPTSPVRKPTKRNRLVRTTGEMEVILYPNDNIVLRYGRGPVQYSISAEGKGRYVHLTKAQAISLMECLGEVLNTTHSPVRRVGPIPD